MNLREGMRRLGLVLGALGFCAGCFGSYLYVEPLLRQRAEAKQKVIKWDEHGTPIMSRYIVQAPDGKTVSLEGPAGASQQQVIAQVQKLYAGQRKSDLSKLSDAQLDALKKQLEREEIPASKYGGIPVEAAKEAKEGLSPWLHYDDSALQAAPSIWRYLPALAFPFLGFLMPWGALKALTWIGTGFVSSSTK